MVFLKNFLKESLLISALVSIEALLIFFFFFLNFDIRIQSVNQILN